MTFVHIYPGTVNGIPVLGVTRAGSNALHFLESPLEPGEEARQVVDWPRRFDNMQQHSGNPRIPFVLACVCCDCDCWIS